ncbi:hypothetical protein ACEN88_28165 [Massilia sp. CT11-108]|uniref:hypothetical protein n=1 Tax=Massilia sp. CT11-108 TaxID=3393900 RepID=UPI0039A600FD
MNTSRQRLAMFVLASALAWRCGAEPLRVAADTTPIDLSTAIRLALDQPAARAAAHEVCVF